MKDIIQDLKIKGTSLIPKEFTDNDWDILKKFIKNELETDYSTIDSDELIANGLYSEEDLQGIECEIYLS